MVYTQSTPYPRDVAVRVLTRVLSEHEMLDEALESVVVEARIDSSARAWLQDVSYGVLRWKGRLDFILDSIALKKKPTGWLRKVLLIGAYQLLAQERTNPARVVSETVDFVKSKEGEFPARFANALLRKITSHLESWRDLPFPGEGAQAATWASLPEWMWKKAVAQHGVNWARTYACASLERPMLWLRGRRADWKLPEAQDGPVPGSHSLSSSGAIPRLPGFSEGEFQVQDISSQKLLAELSEEILKQCKAPVTALDLCAAPGGKAVGLAWNGFQVTATDISSQRMRLLEQTVERTRCSVQMVSWSQVDSLPAQDLVWVDAPCSATGILRRHPEIRWLRQERELASLVATQQELLRKAWLKVKPGGFLAYSVCSVFQEEGPDALKSAELDGTVLRTWFLCPQDPPYGDGFWAALVKKG